MRKMVNNLLAFLIFLSPIVTGLDLSNCRLNKVTTIEKPDCHDSVEQPIDKSHNEENDDFHGDGCCKKVCLDCALPVLADRVEPLNFYISINHSLFLVESYRLIPLIDYNPPFRPPIC